ncbi:MAG: prepilin-type N-terminal cleavage/methylation domain-containing protein [Planctomycetaceae bacterium]|jgi:prepilin-type N-terminal cleavage/methylation domain-containing protein|nr:prepilin-type N-terminal cleavage/methylation domain-containing protein [Planctomycetaceae bacterium]
MKYKALTLIELLVVVSIMVVLAAIAVPSLKPMLKGQQMRSAAQSVSMVLQHARARAMESGTSIGVRLTRFTGGMNEHTDACISMQLYRINKTPSNQTFQNAAIDAGSSENTDKLGVTVDNNGHPQYWILSGIDPNPDPNNNNGAVWERFEKNDNAKYNKFVENVDEAIRAASLVIVGGRSCKIRDGNPPGLVDAFNIPITSPDHATIPNALETPTQMRIVSDNIRPLMIAPTRLPEDTVIDLRWSGTSDARCGATDCFIHDAKDITIVFSPNGEVERIFFVNNPEDSFVPGDIIYLLVGSVDQLVSMPGRDDPARNFEIAENYWVSINPRNGQTAITKVNPSPVDETGAADDAARDALIRAAIHNSRRDAEEVFYFGAIEE